MSCWPSAGTAKRKIRHSTAETPRDPPVRHPNHSALSHPYQSTHSSSARRHTGVIEHRPNSSRRLSRFLSLSSFISFISAPFLEQVKPSSKLAAEIPREWVIEGSNEESQLMETMKKVDSGGSAKKTYSVLPADYRLLEEVGQGASATVYRAMYIPYNEIVAVKCLDLDRCNSNLDDIKREAQTMSLIDHPNVVKGYCSFVVEHFLWVVMPFMAEGSCFHVMKVAHPNGFEEQAICSILKETLKALEYLHKHGIIHRDIKAGNILLDSSGVVKLSDFGVTAGMFDKGDRQRSRNTFIGTPCWMAPEVMQPGGGYDFKADIWSFGITALELAHGHAPFSKYPPMKVLLMTLQNAPPGFDYERDKKFSKSFKEMAAMCLVKDQTKRPTAENLLKHSFFKNKTPPESSVKSLFADLPPLWDRVKALQIKDAEQLALKKFSSSEQEALSMSEYQRGVSAWNFDIEDLKVQASLMVDDENIVEAKEDDGSLRSFINNKEPSTSGSTSEKPLVANKNADKAKYENQLPAESFRHDAQKASNLTGPLMLPNRASGNSFSTPTLSFAGYGDSLEDKFKSNVVQIKGRFSVTSENFDIVKESQLTRFASVADCLINPKQVPSRELRKLNSLPISIQMPHDQNLAQQTSFQQDLLTNLLNSMEQNDLFSSFRTGIASQTFNQEDDVLVKEETTESERLLHVEMSELQTRMISLTDQLTAARLKHAQLQQELNTTYLKRDGEEA